jgi:DNA-binding NarL/FixJ family response regulator
MIKVIIADDQKIIREGLKFIIEQDEEIKVIGLASNGNDVLQLCNKNEADLILLDIVMPELDGIDATKILKEKYQNIKIIILTTFNEEELVTRALKNGADGYILKDIDGKELIYVIKNTLKGLKIFHNNVFDKIVDKIDDQKKIDSSKLNLSGKDLEIVKLIVYGKSNKEIASELNLNEGTIKNMVSSILSKLNLDSRTQLAVFAVNNNLV